MLAVEATFDQAAADQRQAIRAPRQILYAEQGAQVPRLDVALLSGAQSSSISAADRKAGLTTAVTALPARRCRSCCAPFLHPDLVHAQYGIQTHHPEGML